MDRDEITEGQYIYRSDTDAARYLRVKAMNAAADASEIISGEVFGVAPKKPSLVERLRNWLGH